MATIDDAIAFAHEYASLQQACAVEMFKPIAAGKESKSPDFLNPKSPHFRVKRLAAKGAQLWGDGCAHRPGKGKGAKPTLLNKERTLFAVTKHNSKRGDVFVLYMSGSSWEHDSYSEQVVVVEIDGALRYIGRMEACVRCGGTGKEDKKRCSICNGKKLWEKAIGSWPAKEGVNVQKPGKHVEVRKLKPPARPEHRKHYDAL